MPIQGAVLKDGATYAPTGGTDMTFNPISETVPNGIVCANTAQTDFFLREKITASSRLPTRQSDGSYSLQKTSVRIYVPHKRADGTVVPQYIKLDVATDPDAGAAPITKLKALACGVLSDTDFAGLFLSGDLR